MLIAFMLFLVSVALFIPIKIHARNSSQTLLKSAISDPASIALGSFVLLGATIVFVAPIWPALELQRVGLMIFAMGCGYSFLFAFAVVYDENQDRKRKQRPQRTMHKRLQKLRKSNQT